jgi:predicted PhzF superfamily epimerase YddE/YHI9
MSQHLIDSGRLVTSAGPATGDATQADAVGSGGATIGALDALAQALQRLAGDQQLLEARLGELRRRRAEGGAWRDILAEEEPPGTMQVVSRMLATLAGASGTLRKELVDDLRREGASIPTIAKLFGVTHQRVSNLLRRRAG